MQDSRCKNARCETLGVLNQDSRCKNARCKTPGVLNRVGLTRLVIESTKLPCGRRQPNVNPKRKREMIKSWRIVKPRLSLSSALACASG